MTLNASWAAQTSRSEQRCKPRHESRRKYSCENPQARVKKRQQKHSVHVRTWDTTLGCPIPPSPSLSSHSRSPRIHKIPRNRVTYDPREGPAHLRKSCKRVYDESSWSNAVWHILIGLQIRNRGFQKHRTDLDGSRGGHGRSDEVFNRNIERWTRSTTFMVAFAKRSSSVLPDFKTF